jgi:hypothetical protein
MAPAPRNVETLASDLFGKLQPELPEKRKRFVIRNPSFEKIMETYRAYCSDRQWYGVPIPEAYRCARKYLNNVSVSPSDAQLFIMNEFRIQDITEMIPAFTSELINRCEVETLRLHVHQPLAGLCMYLGKDNIKNVIIDGNLGMAAGTHMIAGTLEINGNVDALVGLRMVGGDIIVRGNAGMSVGAHSKGGIIRITGSYPKDDRFKRGATIYGRQR